MPVASSSVEEQLDGGVSEALGLEKLRSFAAANPGQQSRVWAKWDVRGGSSAKDMRTLRLPVAAMAAAVASGVVGPGALPALATSAGAIQAYGDVALNLELGVQLLYLGALLALLGSGSFLVVRQALMRRELENAAKELQERVRSGQATSEEYFELGAVMLRKKFFNLSNKYLEQAIKKWDGDESELAQVHNALGFSYFSEEKVDQAISQYEKAVKLQPGYVTAWNNLGDAYEGKKSWAQAKQAYEEALKYDPNNRVASGRLNLVKERLERFRGVVSKSD